MKMSENESVIEIDQDDDTVTMVDVLNAETKLEEAANAVLGPSDTITCTYSQVSLKRQALYACLTCVPNDGNHQEKNYMKCAAICLACSYSCHEGHELIELYTKRNFQCDCGNGKFEQSFECKLEKKNKDVIPSSNNYNHNFYGYYCTCDRPYPDLNDDVQDEMVQCIICEDWFHFRHLVIQGKAQSFVEIICHLCSESHLFLKKYYSVLVEKEFGEMENIKECKLETITAFINEKNSHAIITETKALLWSDYGWRSMLCTCSKCLQMYTENKLEFLIDTQDTVSAYMEKGAGTSSISQYEQGLNALSSMDGTQQRDILFEYNNMMSHLKDYLKDFAKNNQVVREDDIKEFFSKMKQQNNNQLPSVF